MAPSLKQHKRFWIANKCRCCKQTISFSMKSCLSITSATVWMNHWEQNVSTCHYTSNWPDLHSKISQNPTQEPWKLSRTRKQRRYPQTARNIHLHQKKQKNTVYFEQTYGALFIQAVSEETHFAPLAYANNDKLISFFGRVWLVHFKF